MIGHIPGSPRLHIVDTVRVKGYMVTIDTKIDTMTSIEHGVHWKMPRRIFDICRRD
jgi:hypothetical protein